jgi:hypothetical protein
LLTDTKGWTRFQPLPIRQIKQTNISMHEIMNHGQLYKLNLDKLSKKQISQLVYDRLMISLSEFDLHGKKVENSLKKSSKALAQIIAKQHSKKKKTAA